MKNFNASMFIMFAIVVISSVAITSLFSAYYISEQLNPLITKIKNLEEDNIKYKAAIEIRIPEIEKDLYEFGLIKIQGINKKLGGQTGRLQVLEKRMKLADEEYLILLEQLDQSLPLSLEYKPSYNINKIPERQTSPKN